MLTAKRVIYTDIAPDFSKENGLSPKEAKNKIEETLNKGGQASLVRLSQQELHNLMIAANTVSGLLLVTCEAGHDAEVKPINLEERSKAEHYYSGNILELLNNIIKLHKNITDSQLHQFDSTDKQWPIEVKGSSANNYYEVVTETPTITSTIERPVIEFIKTIMKNYDACPVLTQAKILVTGRSNPNIIVTKKLSPDTTKEINRIISKAPQ